MSTDPLSTFLNLFPKRRDKIWSCILLAIVIGACYLLYIFKSSPGPLISNTGNGNSYQVNNAGRDLIISSNPEKIEEHAAARTNFFRLLKITLHSLKQSLWTLQSIPLDYSNGKDSPLTNPANLRRITLKDQKAVFYPAKEIPNQFHYTSRFFFIPTIEINKTQAYLAFPTSKEVGLALDLIEKIESAKRNLELFWENITEGNIEKPPSWNLNLPENKEIDRSFMRAKIARNYIKDIETLRSILNELRSMYGDSVEIPF